MENKETQKGSAIKAVLVTALALVWSIVEGTIIYYAKSTIRFALFGLEAIFQTTLLFIFWSYFTLHYGVVAPSWYAIWFGLLTVSTLIDYFRNH